MEKSNRRFNRRKFIKGAAVAAPVMAVPGALEALQEPAGRDSKKWDMETDIVVLGTGFAGMSAAITAKDAGVEVVILEKMPREHEGGNSRVSGNMWWTPTNLPEELEYIEALCHGPDRGEKCISRGLLELDPIQRRSIGSAGEESCYLNNFPPCLTGAKKTGDSKFRIVT